jgi:uncharacterized protein (DUF1697 family)
VLYHRDGYAIRSASDLTFIALIRGINVGGSGRLPMTELTRLLETLGCADVRT